MKTYKFYLLFKEDDFNNIELKKLEVAKTLKKPMIILNTINDDKLLMYIIKNAQTYKLTNSDILTLKRKIKINYLNGK